MFIADWNVHLLDINDSVRKKFETRFQCILIFSNSIFCAALADYWLYEILDKRYSYVALLGITGGIVKIFQFINHCSGSILLACTRRALLKRSRKNSLDKQDNIRHSIEYIDDGIEMPSISEKKIVLTIKDSTTPTKRHNRG